MKAFLLAVVVSVVIAVGAGIILTSLDSNNAPSRTAAGVRLG
jgi:hypothetical protein